MPQLDKINHDMIMLQSKLQQDYQPQPIVPREEGFGIERDLNIQPPMQGVNVPEINMNADFFYHPAGPSLSNNSNSEFSQKDLQHLARLESNNTERQILNGISSGNVSAGRIIHLNQQVNGFLSAFSKDEGSVTSFEFDPPPLVASQAKEATIFYNAGSDRTSTLSYPLNYPESQPVNIQNIAIHDMDDQFDNVISKDPLSSALRSSDSVKSGVNTQPASCQDQNSMYLSHDFKSKYLCKASNIDTSTLSLDQQTQLTQLTHSNKVKEVQEGSQQSNYSLATGSGNRPRRELIESPELTEVQRSSLRRYLPDEELKVLEVSSLKEEDQDNSHISKYKQELGMIQRKMEYLRNNVDQFCNKTEEDLSKLTPPPGSFVTTETGPLNHSAPKSNLQISPQIPSKLAQTQQDLLKITKHNSSVSTTDAGRASMDTLCRTSTFQMRQSTQDPYKQLPFPCQGLSNVLSDSCDTMSDHYGISALKEGSMAALSREKAFQNELNSSYEQVVTFDPKDKVICENGKKKRKRAKSNSGIRYQEIGRLQTRKGKMFTKAYSKFNINQTHHFQSRQQTAYLSNQGSNFQSNNSNGTRSSSQQNVFARLTKPLYKNLPSTTTNAAAQHKSKKSFTNHNQSSNGRSESNSKSNAMTGVMKIVRKKSKENQGMKSYDMPFTSCLSPKSFMMVNTPSTQSKFAKISASNPAFNIASPTSAIKIAQNGGTNKTFDFSSCVKTKSEAEMQLGDIKALNSDMRVQIVRLEQAIKQKHSSIKKEQKEVNSKIKGDEAKWKSICEILEGLEKNLCRDLEQEWEKTKQKIEGDKSKEVDECRSMFQQARKAFIKEEKKIKRGIKDQKMIRKILKKNNGVLVQDSEVNPSNIFDGTPNISQIPSGFEQPLGVYDPQLGKQINQFNQGRPQILSQQGVIPGYNGQVWNVREKITNH